MEEAMRLRLNTRLLMLLLLMLLSISAVLVVGRAQKSESGTLLQIPKTWNDKAVADLEVPLADPRYSPVHVSSDYYYRMPVRQIYKSYPIYAPGKEPPGYIEWLKQQEPEIAFDPAKLKTEQDWIKAGELVFNAPIFFNALNQLSDVRDPAWYERTKMPVSSDGIMPYNVY